MSWFDLLPSACWWHDMLTQRHTWTLATGMWLLGRPGHAALQQAPRRLFKRLSLGVLCTLAWQGHGGNELLAPTLACCAWHAVLFRLVDRMVSALTQHWWWCSWAQYCAH
jgi:hypothetical protein